MGSYPPQGFGGAGGSSGGEQLPTVQTAEDEAITVTDAFTNVITFRLNQTVDTILNLFNDDATKTIDFKIYATPKDTATIPLDSDNSWFNILNSNTDPALYDDTLSKNLPAKGIHRESLSNRFGWIRVQMKTATGTAIAMVWIRSTTP